MAGLDVVCKVVVDPASVAQISNFDADDVDADLELFGFSFVADTGRAARRRGCRRRFAETDA